RGGLWAFGRGQGAAAAHARRPAPVRACAHPPGPGRRVRRAAPRAAAPARQCPARPAGGGVARRCGAVPRPVQQRRGRVCSPPGRGLAVPGCDDHAVPRADDARSASAVRRPHQAAAARPGRAPVSGALVWLRPHPRGAAGPGRRRGPRQSSRRAICSPRGIRGAASGAAKQPTGSRGLGRHWRAGRGHRAAQRDDRVAAAAPGAVQAAGDPGAAGRAAARAAGHGQDDAGAGGGVGSVGQLSGGGDPRPGQGRGRRVRKGAGGGVCGGAARPKHPVSRRDRGDLWRARAGRGDRAEARVAAVSRDGRHPQRRPHGHPRRDQRARHGRPGHSARRPPGHRHPHPAPRRGRPPGHPPPVHPPSAHRRRRRRARLAGPPQPERRRDQGRRARRLLRGHPARLADPDQARLCSGCGGRHLLRQHGGYISPHSAM
ncbi:hypothetical protein H4R21_005827, partial [Coemansia helicoidea]